LDRLILVFAILLYGAVLLSGLAKRTPLSITVVFLVVGFVVGNGALGIVRLPLDDPTVKQFAQLALVSVLFVDGMHLDLHELLANRRLPERALLVGLPLTLIVSAALAHFVAGLGWAESLLLGAVLSPTDPVFAAALVGQGSISARLRHLLNIESGLNDGLALPIVLAMVAILWGLKPTVAKYLIDVGLGVLLGIAITWLALKLRQLLKARVTQSYQPLLALAIGLTVYAVCEALGANTFLGMFAAAVTVATTDSAVCDAFRPFGEKIADLIKLAAVLLFGALLSLDFLRQTNLTEFLFAFLLLFLARPIGLGLALLGSRLSWQERAVAVWFGPRGFASVVYGMFILGSGVSHANDLFRLAAVVIVASMIVHSSTDVLAVRWLQHAEPNSQMAGGSDQAAKSEPARAGSQAARPEPAEEGGR
jgi:sodium/hydrogen antiporter